MENLLGVERGRSEEGAEREGEEGEWEESGKGADCRSYKSNYSSKYTP